MDLFGHLAEGVNTAPEAHYPFLEDQVEAVTVIFTEVDVLFTVAEQVLHKDSLRIYSVVV